MSYFVVSLEKSGEEVNICLSSLGKSEPINEAYLGPFQCFPSHTRRRCSTVIKNTASSLHYLPLCNHGEVI